MNKNNEELNKALKGINIKRRSFAKAGMVAPVIMTLANRPAWGGVRTMCSVSGFDSAVVKNAAGAIFSGVADLDATEKCGGVHVAGYWMNNTPSSFNLNTRFEDVFTTASLTGNPKFSAIIDGSLSRNDMYAGLYVDAVEAGLSFPLTTTQIINLYAGTGVDGNSAGWTEVEGDSFVQYLLDHHI
ncbi:MAG: hypothetical protein K9L22_03950 [Methylococcaceae bacterium]|nr:hypothetical protein [Methylococcaceae bacterium]